MTMSPQFRESPETTKCHSSLDAPCPRAIGLCASEKATDAARATPDQRLLILRRLLAVGASDRWSRLRTGNHVLIVRGVDRPTTRPEAVDRLPRRPSRP